MVELIAEYSFLRPDIFIIASVDTETNKQKIILEQRNLQDSKVIRHDVIDCIHSAISQYQKDDFIIARDEIFIESSENLTEINLTSDEVFFSLKSWIEALVQYQSKAFKIQSEVENIGRLGVSLSGRLMRFLALVDINILFNFLDQLKEECTFENKRHDSCLIANLLPIIESLFYLPDDEIDSESIPDIFDENNIPKFPLFEQILKKIFELDPPLTLFTENVDFLILLSHPFAITMSDFSKGLYHEDTLLRKAIVNNPLATSFSDFTQFLSAKTESNEKIRKIAANHPHAPKFKEFTNFLSEKTELCINVRENASSNPKASFHPDFYQLLSFAFESNLIIFRNALDNINNFNKELLIKLKKNPQCNISEIEALLDLHEYLSQIIPHQKFEEFFSFEDDENEYLPHIFNYTLDNGHISEIIIQNFNLHSLPESIANLKYLRKINLEGNKLDSSDVYYKIFPSLIEIKF